MTMRHLLLTAVVLVVAAFIVPSCSLKGDQLWKPAQGPCFNPPYPEPTYSDIEWAAYWQVRFNMLVYKGKQWEDSGTTTRYHTLMNHPELDAMASSIARKNCYTTPFSLPAAPDACTSCTEGSFALVSGIADPFTSEILLNADCLFNAPNVFTYNKTGYTGDPLSVLSPAEYSPEKFLGNPPLGMFSLNILCASGPTVAFVLQYFWDNYRAVLQNPRHNWMGIGVSAFQNGNERTYQINVILAHICHSNNTAYNQDTRPNITGCDDVYRLLENKQQYQRCGLDYINPLDATDRRPWVWAGANRFNNQNPAIFCNGTQSWGPANYTPMPMFFSKGGLPQICPPNKSWKSIEFAPWGFNTCSGGVNACLVPPQPFP